MAALELVLEHRHREKFLRALRFWPTNGFFVIGSSPTADIRVVGPEVSPFHAVLEWRDGQWVVFDFGSTTGTWVDGQSIDEKVISSTTVVQIGQNRLQLHAKMTRRPLFVKDTDPVNDATSDHVHQIVVKDSKGVLSTCLLADGAEFHQVIKGHKVDLSSPKSHQWVDHSYGDLVVRQRLVRRPANMPSPGIEVDSTFRRPLGIAAGVFGLILLLSLALPYFGSDLEYEQPIDKNLTDMIYNAKVIQKKRTESDKLTAVQKARTQDTQVVKPVVANTTETNPAPRNNNGAVVSKTITKIRASGLDQLIGKIAKRASETSLQVVTSGVSPDQAAAPSALGALGKTSDVAGDGKVAASKAARIGSIGTAGKAGSSAAYKQGTGLAAGSVGTGEVGMIEEEGVVEGGLDRDVIAEIIRRDIGQIRFCYERQLSATPELFGKVLVKFEINGEGVVEAPRVGTSTLNSANVEGCILRRVAKWRFPTPKGGTSVLVSYPFLFKTTE
jgi:hypothetical protein